MNWQQTPINIGVAVVASGTVNYTFEYTLEDVSGTYPNPAPINTSPVVFPLTALSGQTATLTSNITTPFTAWRITKNNGTGTVQAIVIQAGV